MCIVTYFSGAGIKSSFRSPGTQTSPGAGQRFTFQWGRKCPSLFPFLWKFGGKVLLGFGVFFLSCGENSIMLLQTASTTRWMAKRAVQKLILQIQTEEAWGLTDER